MAKIIPIDSEDRKDWKQLNAEALKEDVLSVIGQYLSVGRLENLYIEQYIIK